MPSDLTFGYLYDFRNPEQWRRPWTNLYSETLDVIAATEQLGFGGAWVPEHHLADDGYLPSPLVMLAAIAARTSKMRIGTSVALGPLHDPVRFAEDSAVLDIISNGRLDLGLAVGYRRRETAALGVDFKRRGARFDEFLEIVCRLWAGETVDFAGKHFDVQGARIIPPVPRGRIPLFIGGVSDVAVERVARRGDGYVGSPDICDLYLDKLRQVGKDPASGRIRISGPMIAVAHDPQEALDELAPHFLHLNNSYAAWFNEERVDGMEGMKPMTLQGYKDSGVLQVLTPEAAITYLEDLRRRWPVEHFMMMKPPGLPSERFLHYAGVFAREVLPAFAGRQPHDPEWK